MKLIQDFVKSRYSKLSRQLKHVSKASHWDDVATRDVNKESTDKIRASAKIIAEQASIKGTVVEVVEEALKWRLEAQSKKT